MKAFRLGLAATLSILSAVAPVQASTLFFGAYPDLVVAFDEAKGETTDRIKLENGLPIGLKLSNDDKRLYVATISNGGIEVMDVATHKIINKMHLSEGNLRYRFSAGVPDPTGRYYYTIGAKLVKGTDRWTIGKPHYMTIDLQQKKVVRSGDMEPQDDLQTYFRAVPMTLSANGKLLYIFREKITVVDTATMKAVNSINLGRPDGTDMENVNLSGGARLQQTNDTFVSLFTAADPIVHNKIFGILRLNLATQQYTFTPVGPAPSAMAGMEITKDGKEGYAVITNGTLGNKRCEFWRFDLATNKVIGKGEFECKSRYTFGMSGDGEKLYIYGASFDIEVYDRKTFKLEKTWDVGNDITGAQMNVVD